MDCLQPRLAGAMKRGIPGYEECSRGVSRREMGVTATASKDYLWYRKVITSELSSALFQFCYVPFEFLVFKNRQILKQLNFIATD